MANSDQPQITPSPVLSTFTLGSQWPTLDPFLFCAHHKDAYPQGTADLAPNASLAGHTIGSDFDNSDGWNMYHGTVVPGFPQHPHRGFETITYMLEGVLDHADSLGATARLGPGDAQWMTAGAGVQHSEMFPLVNQDSPNPMHMFQIWLNLPAEDKMVDPYFTMLWDESMPTLNHVDDKGLSTDVTILAGSLQGVEPPLPPTNSWASRPESDLGVWHVTMTAGATWSLPAAGQETLRALYLFEGGPLQLDAEVLPPAHGAQINPDATVIKAGDQGAEFMILQGRPIGEPVARYGPFVMNTNDEIDAAYRDYQQTQFGGWPWPHPAPNHGPIRGRFAVHADGRLETAPERSAN